MSQSKTASPKEKRAIKRFLKLLIGLVLLYVLLWLGLAVYFSLAERHKGLLESSLSSLFDAPVTIATVDTHWRGLSPQILIQDLRVPSKTGEHPAFAFKRLSASLDPVSLLTFWPIFSDLAIDEPSMEVRSTLAGKLYIAGLELPSTRAPISKRLTDWLLAQPSASWHNGTVVWLQELPNETKTNRFSQISFVYSRDQERRDVRASVQTRKGPIAFATTVFGNPFSAEDWSADLDILGGPGQSLIRSQDLQVSVQDGEGRLSFSQLDVQRIRDFVLLTGVTDDTGWLISAEIGGSLHDLELNFSGPLLDIQDWSLSAAASDLFLRGQDQAPSMNNLFGSVMASNQGGTFSFDAENATFSWPRWFDGAFPIQQAAGELKWTRAADGSTDLSVENGIYEDANLSITEINARCSLAQSSEPISGLGDLFRVDTVSDLEFEDGALVQKSQQPLQLDASARFSASNLSVFSSYLPKLPRIEKFHDFAEKAFRSGEVRDGIFRYTGALSRTAVQDGSAQLLVTGEFSNGTVDYAPELDWPPVENGAGFAKLENTLLTITPTALTMNGDPVTEGLLTIENIFTLDRELKLSGKAITSLAKGMDFILKGPLLKPQDRLTELPVDPIAGEVEVDVSVTMPLAAVEDTQVLGVAQVRNASVMLPEQVAVEEVNANISFTERSVRSDQVSGRFLGGSFTGQLTTVTPAQPPIMRLRAQGSAQMKTLEPWVGEHVLTLFSGETEWRGNLLFDGPRLEISGETDLLGVEVTAPAPVGKSADQPMATTLLMLVGNDRVQQSLNLQYGELLSARFLANRGAVEEVSLFDNGMIALGQTVNRDVRAGINFDIAYTDLNLDDWLEAVIDLALYEPRVPATNTEFLDAMRTLRIRTSEPTLMSRAFDQLAIDAVSVNGKSWIGRVRGPNLQGTLTMQPRLDIGRYELDIDYLNIPKEPDQGIPGTPIDYSLDPAVYPHISATIDEFRSAGKNMGRVQFSGQPQGDEWRVDQFSLTHRGISTTASGEWKNNQDYGSITRFDFETEIDEAEGALNEMDFDGVIKKGQGQINGQLRWIGAPHEFDYARLNGRFDALIRDGELVQVEPGGGKLVGLLNVNAILRRLVFDFRDVFASGLKFDRMRFRGLLADGEAILQDAAIISPAAFVSLEGKIDLDEETVDLEMHVSPELGGNLALLSAIANPTAGAVVFLTQQLFKDEMRKSSFSSYRALGGWEEFELEEIKDSNIGGSE